MTHTIHVTVMVDRKMMGKPEIFVSDEPNDHAQKIASWCRNKDERCNSANPDQTIWNFLGDNPHWTMLYEQKEFYCD